MTTKHLVFATAFILTQASFAAAQAVYAPAQVQAYPQAAPQMTVSGNYQAVYPQAVYPQAYPQAAYPAPVQAVQTAPAATAQEDKKINIMQMNSF